jgi:hypothetical protein
MKRSLMALGLIVVLGGGCGGDGSSDPTQGKLTIAAQGVSGATGKVALFMVTASGGGPLLGSVCASMTSDPASVSAVARTPSAGNPCDLGAEVVFANGAYEVSGGIYSPGSQTPEHCSRTTVTVAGDTVATMPAFGACQ